MEQLSDIDFENIKKDYENNTISIGVELSLARKFLVECQDIITVLWSCSFTIAFIASFIVYFYAFGVFGILGAIIFCIFFSSYIGLCSIANKSKTVLFYIFLACFLVSFSHEIKYCIFMAFTFGSFVSVYLFYKYISWKIISQIALKEKSSFIYLLENGILIARGY